MASLLHRLLLCGTAGMCVVAAPAPAQAAAGSCLLIGDSTIVGVTRELQRLLGGGCAVSAKVGVSTATAEGWANANAHYNVAVIGTGSNDASSPALAERLGRLRAKINADKVIWLTPYNRRAAGLVQEVATRRGDMTVPLAGFPSKDGIHPTNYTLVARTLFAAEPGRTQIRKAATPVRMASKATPARPVRSAPVPQRGFVLPAALRQASPAPAPQMRSSLARIARPSIARPTITHPTIAIATLPPSGGD